MAAVRVSGNQDADTVFPGFLGAGSIGQPQNAAAIFPGFLVHLDAAIRLERHHVRACFLGHLEKEC